MTLMLIVTTTLYFLALAVNLVLMLFSIQIGRGTWIHAVPAITFTP